MTNSHKGDIISLVLLLACKNEGLVLLVVYLEIYKFGTSVVTFQRSYAILGHDPSGTSEMLLNNIYEVSGCKSLFSHFQYAFL